VSVIFGASKAGSKMAPALNQTTITTFDQVKHVQIHDMLFSHHSANDKNIRVFNFTAFLQNLV